MVFLVILGDFPAIFNDFLTARKKNLKNPLSTSVQQVPREEKSTALPHVQTDHPQTYRGAT